MTRPFPLASDLYTAAVNVGVLGPRLSAVPMIPELIRVVEPGGLLMTVIREQWYVERLEGVVAQLLETRQVTVVQDVVMSYFVREGVNGRYLTLRKNTLSI